MHLKYSHLSEKTHRNLDFLRLKQSFYFDLEDYEVFEVGYL